MLIILAWFKAPEIITQKDPRAQEVFDYLEKISDEEDLKVHFSWVGDAVLIDERR